MNFARRMQASSAFSLLEVIFSLMILTTLSLSLTMLLRSSFEIRESLLQNDAVNHRLSMTLAQISKDLEHAYIISERDLGRYGDSGKRKIKSWFEIIVGGNTDTLRLTTMSHSPMIKNASESDTTFVVYRLEENKETGRTNLMRGESRRVPEDFREDPPMRLLASDMKSIRFRAWRGDDWSKDSWDSSSRDTRSLLPRMVQVELEAYLVPAGLSQQSARTLTTAEEAVLKYQTVVILPFAQSMNELRSGSTSVRWDRL